MALNARVIGFHLLIVKKGEVRGKSENHLLVYKFERNNETTRSFPSPRTCVSCRYDFECESDRIAPIDAKQC